MSPLSFFIRYSTILPRRLLGEQQRHKDLRGLEDFLPAEQRSLSHRPVRLERQDLLWSEGLLLPHRIHEYANTYTPF